MSGQSLADALAAIPSLGSGALSIPNRTVDALLEAAISTVQTHPLLSQIRAASHRGEPVYSVGPALRTVDEVLAEQLWDVCNLVGAGKKNGDVNCFAIAKDLYRAAPVLWLADMVRVTRSLPVPSQILGRDILPLSPLWFTFDVEYGGEELGWDAIYGVLLADVGHIGENDKPGLAGVWIGSKGTELVYQADARPYGGRVPAIEQGALSAFGLLSFFNSPFIPREIRRVSKQVTRAIGRQGWTLENDRTTFIDLRAVVSLTKDFNPGGEHRSYTHRWVVRGHHRAQWYPSTQTHRVIWVAPYVKGPSGTPLAVSAYRVKR